jgi:hypothetical protein
MYVQTRWQLPGTCDNFFHVSKWQAIKKRVDELELEKEIMRELRAQGRGWVFPRFLNSLRVQPEEAEPVDTQLPTDA